MQRYSPAAERNKDPILNVLREHLAPFHTGQVLDIASGTGQHAHWFAHHLKNFYFQPTDIEQSAIQSIAAWQSHSGLPNLLAPLVLNTQSSDWPVAHMTQLVCVTCCNMIHISPWQSAVGLVNGAARTLRPGGLLFLYGPYKVDGVFHAPSNEAFDKSLRDRNPLWGVRDLTDVTKLCSDAGFFREAVIDMPANNYSVIYRRL